MNSVALVLAVLMALAALALIVTTVLWVGKDARRRGFDKVWLLQLLCAVQLPWPFLMYYFLTRALDRRRASRAAGAAA